jgi:hypothetical protein
MVSILQAGNGGNWDDGRLVSLTPVSPQNSYLCTNIQNAATAMFLYNASGNDHDILVNVKTSNMVAPATVRVPGTTGNQGLATIVAINGTTTTDASLTMNPGQPSGTIVQAFLASLAFPMGGSIPNQQLPDNGALQRFGKFCRFYNALASTWYSLTLQSNVYQFMCAQFGPGQNAMTIYCLNPGPNAASNVVQADPQNPVKVQFITPDPSTPQQQIVRSIFGNGGQQLVWINADSIQDSQNATVALLKQ